MPYTSRDQSNSLEKTGGKSSRRQSGTEGTKSGQRVAGGARRRSRKKKLAWYKTPKGLSEWCRLLTLLWGGTDQSHLSPSPHHAPRARHRARRRIGSGSLGRQEQVIVFIWPRKQWSKSYRRHPYRVQHSSRCDHLRNQLARRFRCDGDRQRTYRSTYHLFDPQRAFPVQYICFRCPSSSLLAPRPPFLHLSPLFSSFLVISLVSVRLLHFQSTSAKCPQRRKLCTACWRSLSDEPTLPLII